MDTIVAPITPLTASTVIVVRISGSDALKVFNLMTYPSGKQVDKDAITSNVLSLYTFNTYEGLKDQVMAVYFKKPKSFTGEDVVEISFHGNPLLVHSAFASFYNLGFRNAMPGEFSKSAFLNGKIDLTQAEAIQELISAKTTKGVYYAYEQLTGSVKNKLDLIKSLVLNSKALIEAKIDFPEEDVVDDVAPFIKTNLKLIINECCLLLDAYKSLRFKRDKVSLVLAGKPNVGKSSLLNALLKEERAIVSSTPGTTRDFIKENLYIAGIPLEIIDTAGLHSAENEIESAGIEKSLTKISAADIVVVLLDVSQELTAEDDEILRRTATQNRIVVGNKIDKSKITADFVDIYISAKMGSHINELIGLIKTKLEHFDLTGTSAATALVSERHFFLLTEVVKTLNEMNDTLETLSLDMIAFDFDFVLNKFKEITGETYSEEVLDIIFSKFCIGK